MSLVPVSGQPSSSIAVRLEKLEKLHQVLTKKGKSDKDISRALKSLKKVDQDAILAKIIIQDAGSTKAQQKKKLVSVVKGQIETLSKGKVSRAFQVSGVKDQTATIIPLPMRCKNPLAKVPLASMTTTASRFYRLNNLSQDLETIRQMAYSKSFSSQLLDSRLLSSATLPMKIWVGAWPRPIPRLEGRPEPYKGQCNQLISIISRTVETTSSGWDYNGLPPYLETIRQMEYGKSFTDTYLESSHDEAPATTCVGASRILLKQLKKRHGVEGMLAGMRRHGQRRPFCHAAVIVECQDGYVLIDPYSASRKRILSIGFNQTIRPNDYTSIAASLPGTDIPLQLTYNDEEVLTYYTHLANVDDLVLKNYMMEIVMQPPPPGQYPAFSASVYHHQPGEKKTIKRILISPLGSKLIFKDLTALEGEPRRTTEISFQEAALTDKLSSTLKYFYSTQPTFRIEQEKLYQQLLEFVQKVAIINQTFYGIEE